MITGKVNEKPLKGLTSTLSDYDCGDGELQVCHNMLNDGTGLRPVEDCQVLSNIPENQELVYVHHTENGVNYICVNRGGEKYNKNGLGAYSESGKHYQISGKTGYPLVWTDGDAISSVGNILIYNESDTTLHYIKWSGEEDGYEYFGDKIPELKLEFGLKLVGISHEFGTRNTWYVGYTGTDSYTEDMDNTQIVAPQYISKVDTDETGNDKEDMWDDIVGLHNKTT